MPLWKNWLAMKTKTDGHMSDLSLLLNGQARKLAIEPHPICGWRCTIVYDSPPGTSVTLDLNTDAVPRRDQPSKPITLLRGGRLGLFSTLLRTGRLHEFDFGASDDEQFAPHSAPDQTGEPVAVVDSDELRAIHAMVRKFAGYPNILKPARQYVHWQLAHNTSKLLATDGVSCLVAALPVLAWHGNQKLVIPLPRWRGFFAPLQGDEVVSLYQVHDNVIVCGDKVKYVVPRAGDTLTEQKLPNYKKANLRVTCSAIELLSAIAWWANEPGASCTLYFKEHYVALTYKRNTVYVSASTDARLLTYSTRVILDVRRLKQAVSVFGDGEIVLHVLDHCVVFKDQKGTKVSYVAYQVPVEKGGENGE